MALHFIHFYLAVSVTTMLVFYQCTKMIPVDSEWVFHLLNNWISCKGTAFFDFCVLKITGIPSPVLDRLNFSDQNKP